MCFEELRFGLDVPTAWLGGGDEAGDERGLSGPLGPAPKGAGGPVPLAALRPTPRSPNDMDIGVWEQDRPKNKNKNKGTRQQTVKKKKKIKDKDKNSGGETSEEWRGKNGGGEASKKLRERDKVGSGEAGTGGGGPRRSERPAGGDGPFGAVRRSRVRLGAVGASPANPR